MNPRSPLLRPLGCAAPALALALVLLAGCGRPGGAPPSGAEPSATRSPPDAPNNDSTPPVRPPAAATGPADETPTAGGGRNFDDAWLSGKISAALIADKRLSATAIHVQVREGVAWLSGTVPDRGQIERAVSTARGVEGVKRVESRLEVPR